MTTYPSQTTLRIFCTFGALLLVCSACKEPNPAFNPDPIGSGGSGSSALACSSGAAPVEQPFQGFADPNKLDVLFVVSTSPSSDTLQQRLSEATVPFLTDLSQAGLDLHVGVIDADPSATRTFGSLRASQNPDCANSTRILSSAELGADLPAQAACNILQGSTSQTPPHLLAAAQAALTTRASDPDPDVGNVPFLRPDARLAIVFLSDTDDCSNTNATLRPDAPNNATACAWASQDLSPTSEFINAVSALKPDQSATFITVLAGPDSGQPSPTPPEQQETACDDQNNLRIYAAPRLASVQDTFTPDSLFASACTSFYNGALNDLKDALLARSTTTLCLPSAPNGPILSVQDDQGQDLPAGRDGYIYTGPTERCPQGALLLAAQATQGQDASVRVTYCASE